MFIRLKILIAILACFPFVSNSQQVVSFELSNIEHVDVSPKLITDGKQVYIVVVEHDTNPAKIRTSLEQYTQQKVTSIGENLFRVSIIENEISRDKLSKLLSLKGVKGLYQNSIIALDTRDTFSPSEKLTVHGKSSSVIIPSKKENSRASKSMVNTHRQLSASIASNLSVNDHESPAQWALENTGQGIQGRFGEPGVDIGAELAWQSSLGLQDGIVAVFGNRVAVDHEDLTESIWTNALEIPDNNIDDDQNGYVDDVYGINSLHDSGDVEAPEFSLSTAITGIISAKRNNSIGIAGVTENDKVIHCVMLEAEVETTIDDIAQCFGYIIDLKVNRGLNIHSVVIPWGINTLHIDSAPWFKFLIESLIPYDIFVVAASRLDDYPYFYVDAYPDLPSSYDLPNVISVTVIDSLQNLNSGSGSYSSRAGRGWRTVHTAAPGVDIVTTVPGFIPVFNNNNSIFFESFESGGFEQWEATGDAYTIADEISSDGNSSLKLANNIDTLNESQEGILTSQPMDLRSYRGEKLAITFKTHYYPDLDDRYGAGAVDFELVLADGTTQFLYFFSTNFNVSPHWRKRHIAIYPEEFGINLTDEQLNGVKIRIVADNIDEWSSYLNIDEIAFGVVDSTGSANNYDFFNGTAPSAAHVAAGISIIKNALPNLSMSQIRNLITSTGKKFDLFQWEDGKTADPVFTQSNKSFKLSSNDESSVLTCNDQLVTRRTEPKVSGEGTLVGVANVATKLSVININCGEPSGSPEVFVKGEPVELLDDGQGKDSAANDGIYSLDLNIASLGDSRIEITGEPLATLDYRIFTPYLQGELVDYEWETPQDDQYNDYYVDHLPPFPINIGNIKDDHQLDSFVNSFWVSPDGGINIDYLLVQFENDPAALDKHRESSSIDVFNSNNSDVNQLSAVSDSYLPIALSNRRILIAPFVRKIVPLHFDDDRLISFVLGEAPERKWILQWSGYRESECSDQQEQIFQAVFNESHGDIQFNYKQVGESCAAIKPGVGIQIGNSFNVVYDGVITDEMSLKFSLPHNDFVYINQTPKVIQELPRISIEENEYFELDLALHFQDDVQESLTYTIFLDEKLTEIARFEGVEIENGILKIQSSSTIDEIIFIEAKDEYGLSVFTRGFLEVNPLGPQIIKEFEDLGVYINEEHTIDLAEYVRDQKDSVLSYQIDLPDGSYQFVDNLLTVNFSEPETHNFYLIATDSDNQYRTLTGKIEAFENSAPYIRTPLDRIEVEQLQSIFYDLNDYFKDDQDDILQFSIEGFPSGVSLSNGILGGSTSVTGTFSYTITGIDSKGLSVEVAGTMIVKVAEQISQSSSGGGASFWSLMCLGLLMVYRHLVRLRYNKK